MKRKAVALIALGLFACSTGRTNEKKTDKGQAKAQPMGAVVAGAKDKVREAQEKKAEQAKQRMLAFVHSCPWMTMIQGNGIMLSLVDVVDNPKDSLLGPSAGNKLILLELDIINSKVFGTKPLRFNPLYIKLKDATGGVYTATPTGKKPRLGVSVVDKGDNLRGWIGFEVPTGVSVADCRIRYESFTVRSAWIKLDLTEQQALRMPKYKELFKRYGLN